MQLKIKIFCNNFGRFPICFLLFLTAPLFLYSQTETEDNAELQQVIENIVEQYEADDVDLTDLQYWLTYYYENKLELNYATAEDLQNLYILTAQQVEKIIQHRQQFGKFISIFELQAVEGLDLETIRKLLPFSYVSGTDDVQKYSLKQMLNLGRHDVMLRYMRRLEQERGYKLTTSRRFLGSADALLLRYNYRFSNRLSLGFTAEKDAGEEFFKGSQKQGFDFYSAHIFYSGNGRLKTLAVGDYLVQFGQGLVMWSSFGISKTADVLNIARQGRGVMPFRSTNENAFLRGSAVAFSIKDFTITAFASYKNIDAGGVSATDTLNSEDQFFTSLQQTGLHRNTNELSGKNAITEMLGGAEVLYRTSRLKLGVTTVYGLYSHFYSPNNRLYNTFAFRGNEFFNSSIHYTYLLGNAYIFGETAITKSGAKATVNGLMASLNPRLDVGLLYRNYAKDYFAPFSRAFGENVRNANEEGFYLAAAIKLASKWKLNAYADIFKFKWLRYRVDAPSEGYEYLADLHYLPSKKTAVYLRYRLQNKPLNYLISNEKMHAIEPSVRSSWRLHFQHAATESIRLRTRVEFSNYKKGGGVAEEITQAGFLGFQDVVWSPIGKRYKFSARYVFFDVTGFDTRIYTFENDVPYTFSVPFFADEGVRYYLLAQYNFKNGFSFYGRISRTRFWNRETVGSDLTLVDKPLRTEVKFMLRYRFGGRGI